MCTSISSVMNKKELKNWAELPSDLTSEILSRLDAFDILKNAQKVCKSWHRVCKDPWMWRKIDIYNTKFCVDMYISMYNDLMIMSRHAVDRSQGGLVDIGIWKFCTDELLHYIADRSSNLRCLRLQRCFPRLTHNGLISALMKLPFLEDLEISQVGLYGKLDLKAIGNCCLLLKTLKLNRLICNCFIKDDPENLTGYDYEAQAIAETMSELRHLELRGNTLTNSGLKSILDNCLRLEHLDLRYCPNINLVGDLEKRCSDQIFEILI